MSPSFDDSGPAWMDATVGVGFVPTDDPTEVPNSVTDFSGVQGQDNWDYGAWYKSLDADGLYESKEFTKAVDRSYVAETGISIFLFCPLLRSSVFCCPRARAGGPPLSRAAGQRQAFLGRRPT